MPSQKFAAALLIFSCLIGAPAFATETTIQRQEKLAKWADFNNEIFDDLVKSQEDEIRHETIATMLHLLGVSTQDAEKRWVPGVAEYEEVRSILDEALKPVASGLFSEANRLTKEQSWDFETLSDSEVDSLYTFSTTFPKERWITISRCSVGAIIALNSAFGKQAASLSDEKLRRLIPAPEKCNPTPQEASKLDSVFNSSAFQKIVQANVKMVSSATTTEKKIKFQGMVAELYKRDILPKITPAMRRFVKTYSNSN